MISNKYSCFNENFNYFKNVNPKLYQKFKKKLKRQLKFTCTKVCYETTPIILIDYYQCEVNELRDMTSYI